MSLSLGGCCCRYNLNRFYDAPDEVRHWGGVHASFWSSIRLCMCPNAEVGMGMLIRGAIGGADEECSIVMPMRSAVAGNAQESDQG